ncbi:MAG: LLM class flavin-dependent oxidoreductase [Anaerolineae bacterium]|nr:LLM class flavin-dependent oxidoreductase [Anaerolineae bacterium]
MQLTLGAGFFWTHQPFAEFASLLQECEQLGYDQLWLANEKFFHDMYVTATVAAERTTRPAIGTFVADPYTQHPALTAMAIGSLDEVSGGRAILGIGAGGTGFPPMAIERVKPAKAIKEAIHVIRPLLAGEVVNYQGEIITFRNGRLNFEARPNIPIIVASRGDRVLQVGGEVADGVMIATYAEPVGIGHALAQIEKGAQRAGRSLKDLRIVSRIDACINQDRAAAFEAVKPMVAVFLWTSYPDRTFVERVGLAVPPELEQIIARRDYNLLKENAHLVPDSFVEKFCWAGTAEQVAHKVAQVAAQGIHEITILPHPPAGGDVKETLREFASAVKPLVEDMLA